MLLETQSQPKSRLSERCKRGLERVSGHSETKSKNLYWGARGRGWCPHRPEHRCRL